MVDETRDQTAAAEESGTAEDNGTGQPTLESLQAQLDEALAEKDRYHRAYSDAVDSERRRSRLHEEERKYAAEGALMQILESVDNMERAFMTVPATMLKISEQVAWLEGISLIYQKLLGTLQANGVTEIEASAGAAFDPTQHEAISRAPGAEGTVVDVLQKGYTLHDRVLRPALVQVGDGSSADESTS